MCIWKAGLCSKGEEMKDDGNDDDDTYYVLDIDCNAFTKINLVYNNNIQLFHLYHSYQFIYIQVFVVVNSKDHLTYLKYIPFTFQNL